MNRLWQARDASVEAVNRCDAAVFHARQVVDAGDDVVRLQAIGVVDADNDDAEALAAQDASARCAAASLAAQEASALCARAASQESQQGYRKEATVAAQQALAAAVRCDVAAATAASRAANAFADRCVAACGDAAAKTLAAREAAARCVLARDDADTAALVAHGKAYRESADGHMKARKDALAAALAAREAAVHCAAASRHAVSAASIARKTASHCEASDGDGAAAAAAAARQAADRCVAAAAGEAATGLAVPLTNAADPTDAAADLAVPRADRAASEAREAAGSCDAALADPVADADNEFLDKMRGWVMTVATLFVGIAFQAIVHPPDGMSWDQCARSTSSKAGRAASGAPSPSPAPSTAETADNFTSTTACPYLFANTFTMAAALTLLVVLLTMKKATSRITLLYIQAMLVSLTFMVATSFITGISGDQHLQRYILIFFGLYAIFTFLYVKRGTGFIRQLIFFFVKKGRKETSTV